LRQFFDSSVLIAAFWGGHVHHGPSIKLLASANKKDSCCGIHTLAEVFAVMTAAPLKPLIPPEQGLLFVGEIRQRLALVSLDPEEYFATIRNAAEQGVTGGRVYDALLLGCAAKSRAKTIYTWNLKHFQLLAPHLGDRIRTP
jgi:predicted nucleic acid-binding protein